jgi:hypothetical protein
MYICHPHHDRRLFKVYPQPNYIVKIDVQELANGQVESIWPAALRLLQGTSVRP